MRNWQMTRAWFMCCTAGIIRFLPVSSSYLFCRQLLHLAQTGLFKNLAIVHPARQALVFIRIFLTQTGNLLAGMFNANFSTFRKTWCHE
ncbi:hypothetical protein LPB67_04130 [Undibacterium sp. Jales W-56]|uniref:hypothetical protein n=1 Tax=Undibacterium sp. Jales W-56 TaxID=2897325 RepID=UPI0021CE6B27|nr:hypothetical protein [Undibacterium sp. Jales W-56]MCU6432964.1 hypothetical protein [Undibacterium sp. Jales W-56]